MKPIYISRKVLNTAPVDELAARLGITDRTEYAPHITVAYSVKPVDWTLAAFQPIDSHLGYTLRNPEICNFDGWIVLQFDHPELTRRWEELIAAGASWDHDEYRPHITIGYVGSADFPIEVDVSREVIFVEFSPEVREDLVP